MSETVKQAVRELIAGFPISLAFINSARRHGLELRYECLYDRVVECIAEHVLLLVGDEDQAAINLLFSTDSLALTAMVSENFISHLATSNLGCAPLWIESEAA